MALRMLFDKSRYGPQVEAILKLDERDGLMPLAFGSPASVEARSALTGLSARQLFPESRAPEAALSGLWLLFSYFDESHTISQDIHTADGSYWHGIAHRQEPDEFNAKYWFRKVGQHAIFPELAAAVLEIDSGSVLRMSPEKWDPFQFIDFCEGARARPGSGEERVAREIQRAEWRLLFDYCARSM